MKILVIYQSKTGYTKKYAEWISKELKSDLKEIKKVSASEISNYDLIIHGGWIMGGIIKGLKKVKKFNPKELIVFGVGFTKKDKANLNKIVKDNKIEDIPFYYYEGGTNPKKMGFFGRTIVKMVTKQKVTYVDNTNKKEISNLVNFIKNKK